MHLSLIQKKHGDRIVGNRLYTAEEIADGALNPSGIFPIDLRVLALPDGVEKVTPGGIILIDSATEKEEIKQCKATLVEVGTLAWAEAERQATELGRTFRRPAPGDRVLMSLHGGLKVDGKDGVRYRMLNDVDITAFLDE